eukprot:TRINITY_DN6336_c1_g2_i2.p1 TRINITY_DN6336_c1_g2~~TRINITY_DN6336_c1_g2_i2.p1  ORF type:complete len:256 (+),score=56.17 TRINITY_DN6336_c1_g2_i2:252-1019(+)
MRGALASTTCSSSSAAVPRSSSSSCIFGRPLFNHATSSPKPRLSLLPFKIRLRVLNDYTRKGSGMSSDPTMEISEVDKLVDGMDFGELCNDFECKSSPSVESTARQLARDILELRQGNRALGTFSVSVKYKTVQEMLMLSTSVLSIKWTIKGKPKFFALANVGDLIIIVNSLFTLNQISGQVIEHEELWDLSASSAIGRAYFWTSRRLFAAIESGKDVVDAVKDKTSNLSMQKENLEIFPDPSGDPTKVNCLAVF